MDEYSVIDPAVWPRAQHCAVFRGQAIPTYTVAWELEVTAFREWVRARRLSFTLSMIYCVARCANGIENFRYRFLDGRVVCYRNCSASFVWLNRETELFKFVACPVAGTLPEFVREAGRTAEAQQAYFVAPPPDGAFVFSPLPWISYTAKSHTHSGNPEQASPIFDWGKFQERDGRWMMPFSAQVHHSFVDGLHLGKLAEALQEALARPDGI